MGSHSNPTDNLASIFLDESPSPQLYLDDINDLINGPRHMYYYNPEETFSEPDVTELINVVHNYLKDSVDLFESKDPVNSSRNDDEQLVISKSNNTSLPVTRPSTAKSTIALSDSVAVTNSKSSPLQLIYPLEDTYRPRYKSDYFPQNGVVRRPRYIADSASNHFITLQLPAEYQHDLQNCYIRIALITQSIEGHGHYYSPYKFQIDHNDSRVPDENPTFIKVETGPEDSYTVRLQLVLIKSKLDHLNYAQPLQLFSNEPTATQNIIHEEKLSPKDLINHYQLDKSHIAFTLCTKLPDGTFKPHPKTTVISSVIREASWKKTNESTAVSNVDTAQNTCCPHCAHRFDRETPSSSKPSRSRSQTSTETHSSKKRKDE